MAIRIEDTAHETISLDNKPFIVGSLPHRVRLRLMHQHLADETIDIVDVLDDRFVFGLQFLQIYYACGDCYLPLYVLVQTFKCMHVCV